MFYLKFLHEPSFYSLTFEHYYILAKQYLHKTDSLLFFIVERSYKIKYPNFSKILSSWISTKVDENHSFAILKCFKNIVVNILFLK